MEMFCLRNTEAAKFFKRAPVYRKAERGCFPGIEPKGKSCEVTQANLHRIFEHSRYGKLVAQMKADPKAFKLLDDMKLAQKEFVAERRKIVAACSKCVGHKESGKAQDAQAEEEADQRKKEKTFSTRDIQMFCLQKTSAFPASAYKTPAYSRVRRQWFDLQNPDQSALDPSARSGLWAHAIDKCAVSKDISHMALVGSTSGTSGDGATFLTGLDEPAYFDQGVREHGPAVGVGADGGQAAARSSSLSDGKFASSEEDGFTTKLLPVRRRRRRLGAANYYTNSDDQLWRGALSFADRSAQLVSDCMSCLHRELEPHGMKVPATPTPHYLTWSGRAAFSLSISSDSNSQLDPLLVRLPQSKPKELRAVLSTTGCTEVGVRMWCLETTPEALFFNRTEQYIAQRGQETGVADESCLSQLSDLDMSVSGAAAGGLLAPVRRRRMRDAVDIERSGNVLDARPLPASAHSSGSCRVKEADFHAIGYGDRMGGLGSSLLRAKSQLKDKARRSYHRQLNKLVQRCADCVSHFGHTTAASPIESKDVGWDRGKYPPSNTRSTQGMSVNEARIRHSTAAMQGRFKQLKQILLLNIETTRRGTKVLRLQSSNSTARHHANEGLLLSERATLVVLVVMLVYILMLVVQSALCNRWTDHACYEMGCMAEEEPLRAGDATSLKAAARKRKRKSQKRQKRKAKAKGEGGEGMSMSPGADTLISQPQSPSSEGEHGVRRRTSGADVSHDYLI